MKEPSCACYTFMKCPVAALKARIPLKPKFHKAQKQGTVASYCETVFYLLKTYANDNVITETGAYKMSSTQLCNKLPTE